MSLAHSVQRLACTTLAILSFSFTSLSGEIPNLNFEQIRALSSLPNNEILNLLQDSDGFIWIATRGGLYKYDGFDITELRSNLYHPGLLSDNWVSTLAEDNDKRLFIGTRVGLNVLNKRTGEIIQVDDEHYDHNFIASILPFADNEVWTATNRGLIIYHPLTGEATTTDYHPLQTGAIKDIIKDSNGDIWVGTWDKGLFRYSPSRDMWTEYPQFTPRNSIHVLFEDSWGRLWAGTFGEGLLLIENKYDKDNLSVTRFSSEEEYGLSDDFIYAITENKKTGTLWVGTRKGISITHVVDARKIKWEKLYSDSISGNEVDALINDNHDNLWIGTLSGISYAMSSESGFNSNPMTSAMTELKSSSVTSIMVDNDGKVWTGVASNGISIFNPKTGEENLHKHFDWGRNGHKFSMVPYILQSKTTGDILLGTIDGIYALTKDSVAPFEIPFPELRRRILKIVEIPSKGYLICGKRMVAFLDFSLRNLKLFKRDDYEYTCGVAYDSYSFFVGSASNGIFKIMPGVDAEQSDSIREYNINNGGTYSDNIIDMFLDSSHRLWVGTDGGGLCYYNEDEDRFISVNTLTDFPTDIVSSIIEDRRKNLWIGTNIGLIWFFPGKDIAESSFRIYDDTNGLTDKMFKPRAVSMSDDGTLYFGNNRGYVYFRPEEILSSNDYPEVMITDIKLDNRSICQLPDQERLKICGTSPEYTYKMKVGWQYNSISINFSPLVYSTPNRVRYAYLLEGFDNEWQYTDHTHRVAHYTNLRSGNYTFHLKTTNESGQWNDHTRDIRISIIPPIWKTWWAFVLYALLGISLAWSFYRSAQERMKIRNDLQMQQAENERNVELNQAKLRFFTNITHELFTPLTIIAAASEEVKCQIPEQEYSVISSNISRLTRLIQQILEFRKAETGNLRLQVSKRNMWQFIDKNIESFGPLMKNKNIRISFNCADKTREAFFDADKIDKIMYNLLSNALKYNKDGAEIVVTLSFSEDGESASLSVEDNGEGLSESAMNNLFKRFYDGDFRKFNTSGTGIGLSLVNDLVKLHKGTIQVDNHPGSGVKFLLNIPITIKHYTKEECEDLLVLNTEQDTRDSMKDGDNLYRILVVEDNPDLNYVIKNMLARHYEVFSATNGTEAMDLVKNEDIDLIVSDVMMPGMDGFELCSRIKNNLNYSHIQIILVTAKTEDEDVVEAYRSGADAYIPKPFSVRRLNARIQNLLQAREKRIEMFKQQFAKNDDGFNFKTLDYTPYDERFLKEVIEIINDNYMDHEFDQNLLLEKLCVSKSTLHRKLASLAGTSASAMIRDARLNAAYALLEKNENSMVSEIAYAVGFNNPKHFSICFKKKFGLIPSEINKEVID